MSDFSTLRLQANIGASDSNPTWGSIAFGGSGGANEIRFCAAGAGAANTPSASWPYFTRQASVVTVPEAWLFTADASGSKITSYDATSAHYSQFRWDWDAIGTFASAPQFTAFSDATHQAPVAGAQPGAQSGSPIINGSADTNNTSYLKAAAFGYGVDSSGAQQTPTANAGGTLTATSGAAGGVTTASAAWSAWQSLQGFTGGQYIVNGAVPKALVAGDWYFLLALFSGPNEATGSMLPVLTFQYSYA